MERRIIDLSKYRFGCCHEALEDAKIMYEAGRYKNTLNRAYYSIFHGMRAVNALDSFDSSKHSGVIAHFNQNYVKEGIFPKETSKIIRLASEKRENANYLDFYVASKDEAKAQIERAEAFSKWIDGGGWMKKGMEMLGGSYVVDEYHMKKYVKRIVRINGEKEEEEKLMKYLEKGERKKLKEWCQEKGKGLEEKKRKSLEESVGYLEKNWKGV